MREYTAIFVDDENTIYATDRQNNQILMWHNGSSTPVMMGENDLIDPRSLFVTSNGDIYVDNGCSSNRIDKWTSNATNSTHVISVNGSCTGLFIDDHQHLYCSLAISHRVLMFELGHVVQEWTNVAGTGCPGPLRNMLDHPHGIFLDSNSNLYVADTNNNRIQFFPFHQSNGITVAGYGSSIDVILNRPTGIILDDQNYLFIVDSHNHRIIRSIENGFRCIIGCSDLAIGGSNQLNYPHSLAFDSSGNILVTDLNNRRIQKFRLTSNPRSKSILWNFIVRVTMRVESSLV